MSTANPLPTSPAASDPAGRAARDRVWLRLLTLGIFLVAGALWVGQRPNWLLSAQDRGPSPRPPGGGTGRPPGDATTAAALVQPESHVMGAAADMIAVTGISGVGTSLLYVLDAKSKHLAVYEARGGSTGMRRLFLVGARRIDLDLMLDGYNDDSEHTYTKLREAFIKAGHKVPETTGVTKEYTPESALRSGTPVESNK